MVKYIAATVPIPIVAVPVASRGLTSTSRPPDSVITNPFKRSAAFTMASKSDKTVLSSSRLQALKASMQNIHSAMNELQKHVGQAEKQIEELQKSKKREGSQENDGPSSKKQATSSSDAGNWCIITLINSKTPLNNIS